MQGVASDIWWALMLGTIALLAIAIGLIAIVVTGKQRELIAKKRQLEELAISERKYRNLFEHSSAGMIRVTTDRWNVVDANHALLLMLRVNKLEEVQEVLMNMSVQDRKNIIKQLSSEGTIEDFKTLLHRKDGSELWISFSASLLASESLLEAVIIDITTRLQAEEKIREQAKLLDLAPDAILVLDLNNRVRYWNKSAEQVYGYQPLEIVGKDITKYIYAEGERERFDRAYGSTMQLAEWSGELYQRKKDGTAIITDCRWTIVRTPNGEPAGILQVCTDITERKRLEARFLQAQRVESIGIFASGIAHDLNNTLAPVLVGVEVLKRKMHDQQSRRLLKIIESSVKRGSEMVYQVLSFVNGVKGTHVKLNPLKIAKDVTHILGHIIPRSINVCTRIADKISPITGDATQLHQVLINLCTNARDAMPQGGTLTLTVENIWVTKDMIQEYTDADEGAYIVFSISDTGIGISMSEIHKIFEPFYTTKEIGRGTGLGLSICLGIIKGHNGFIAVESTEGKGTTFKIFLPAISSTRAGINEADIQQEYHRQIILATNSDNEDSQILFDGLEDQGYEPILAVGNSEAREIIFHNLDNVQIVVLEGFSYINTLSIIEDTLEAKPEIQFLVMSDKFQFEEIKGNGIPHPPIVLKQYILESLLDTIEHLNLGEVKAK